MATIPMYGRRHAPSLTGGASHQNAQDPVAGALKGMASPVTALGLTLQDKMNKEEEYAEIRQADQFSESLKTYYNDRLNRSKGEFTYGQDYAESIDKDYMDDYQRHLKVFKTKAGNDYFRKSVLPHAEAVFSNATQFEVQENRRYEFEDVTKEVERAAAGVYDDPANFEMYHQDVTNRLNQAPNLTAADKLAISNDALNSMSFASTNSLVFGSPSDRAAFAYKYKGGIEADLGLPATERNSIVTPQEQASISAIKISPEQDAILKSKAKDEFEYKMLRTALVNENAGHGRIRNDLASPKKAVGPFQIIPLNYEAAGYTAHDMTDFNKSSDVALRVIRDGRRAYGDNELANMAWYNGGDRQAKIVAKGGIPKNVEANRYYRYSVAQGLGEPQKASDEAVSGQQMELPPEWYNLTHPQKQQIYNGMLSSLKGDDGASKKRVVTDYEQVLAAARDGIMPSAELMSGLTKEHLMLGFGDEWEKKDRALSGAINVIPLINQMPNMTNEQLNDVIDTKLSSSDIYTDNRATMNAFSSAAGGALKQRADDPVAYITENNEAVKMLDQRIAQYASIPADAPDAEKQNAAVMVRNIRQERNDAVVDAQKYYAGMREFNHRQGRVLSNQEKEQIENKLASKEPNERLATVLDMQDLYGDHFADALNDVVSGGKVNYEFAFLLDANPKSWKAIVDVTNRKPNELIGNVSVANLGVIKKEVDKYSSEYAKTESPTNELAPEMINAHGDLLTKMSLVYARNGIDPAKAVEMAANDLRGGYIISDGMKIPAHIVNDRSDTSALTEAGRVKKTTDLIKKRALAVLEENIGDVYISQENGDLYTYSKDDLIRSKLHNFKFVFTPDDTGVEVFAIDVRGIPNPITRKDKKPFIVPVDERMFPPQNIEWHRRKNKILDAGLEDGQRHIEEYGRYD